MAAMVVLVLKAQSPSFDYMHQFDKYNICFKFDGVDHLANSIFFASNCDELSPRLDCLDFVFVFFIALFHFLSEIT